MTQQKQEQVTEEESLSDNSSNSNNNIGGGWFAPLDLYKKLDREFHFTTDPCADPTNTFNTDVWYPKETGKGLVKEWGGNVFICPSFDRYGSRKMEEWLQKASDYVETTGNKVVFLLKATTDVNWFHLFVWNDKLHKPYKGTEIRFLSGRLKYRRVDNFEIKGKGSANFPSMIVVFYKPGQDEEEKRRGR